MYCQKDRINWKNSDNVIIKTIHSILSIVFAWVIDHRIYVSGHKWIDGIRWVIAQHGQGLITYNWAASTKIKRMIKFKKPWSLSDQLSIKHKQKKCRNELNEETTETSLVSPVPPTVEKNGAKKMNWLPLWLNARTLVDMTGNCVKEEEPPPRIELRINAFWAMKDDVIHEAACDCVRMNKYVYRSRARFQSWAIIKMNTFHAFALERVAFVFLSIHYPLHPATYTAAVMIRCNNKHGNLLCLISLFCSCARTWCTKRCTEKQPHIFFYSSSKTFKW